MTKAKYEVVIVPSVRAIRLSVTTEGSITSVTMASDIAADVISDLTSAMNVLFPQGRPVAVKR